MPAHPHSHLPGPVQEAPSDGDDRRFSWYAGDHHIHTTFSRDAMYTIDDQVRRGQECGLDWMVITDHGGPDHQKLSVARQAPEIAAARERYSPLVFQGLEWNIPGAEHATVIVPPHERTVPFLEEFERRWDGDILAAASNPAGPRLLRHSTEGGELARRLGLEALAWMCAELERGTVDTALVLGNHPMRTGRLDPSRIRQWRDAAPGVFVGWEGAPGHQAAALPEPYSRARGRGQYDEFPGPLSFPGYDVDQYRTWGGFDAATARVGGLWDSLLAEGLPWWITANSDNHFDHMDTVVVGEPSRAFYEEHGHRGVPVQTGTPQHGYVDFAPGFYSRTYVGAQSRDHRAVMAALRTGRVFVTHGGLLDAIEARVRPGTGPGASGPGVTFGSRLRIDRGDDVHVELLLDPASVPNGAGEVPRVARIDVIAGTVTGRVADADADLFEAPGTRVVETFEVPARARGRQRFEFVLRGVADPLYLRFRASDGRHCRDDGHPLVDVIGDSDPWDDLWCYTNPVFVDVG
ncbi:histidinol phosphatase-like PHP family hydrolase [Kineococcus xinjiangensis]|uniref:Histidinol phosphatase-like PHP family hydrolase n=1 Tax=Kineococcus xinjiangensis TaxID=512762 RepID=A0A2S6ITV6_9ACTN|nr:PHP domain-containing protein [Kineococcus xinjiangensis]PPK97684.1 histidinol phosphatase-like PHP family hydrolase [Kineococcus xinjiangensis]